MVDIVSKLACREITWNNGRTTSPAQLSETRNQSFLRLSAGNREMAGIKDIFG
jgi:hypothetical protein